MTNFFNGTVLVLTSTENAEAIAQRIAESYYSGQEYHFRLTDATPEGLPTDLHDQVEAKLRDTPGATVLTVYPFANSLTA